MPLHTCLFSPERITQSALAEQCLTLYLICARRRRLRVNYVKMKGLFNLVRLSYKSRIWQRFEILLLIRVYWFCIPVSAKANMFSSWFIPFSSWTLWWVVKHRTSEKYITNMASFSNKKFKRNLNESDSSDNETEAPFPRFIIIESNSAPITNLSPFIIEKVMSTNLTWMAVKEFKKSNSARRGRKEETRWFSTQNDKVSQYQCQNVPS